MALEVEIQRPSGLEIRQARSIKDMVDTVYEFLAGQIDKPTARPDNSGLVSMLERAEDFSQGVSQPVVDIIVRNNGTLKKLVEAHGVYFLAAAVALARQGYLGSDTALINTAKALEEFGAMPTGKALNTHPQAREIYNAAREEAARLARSTSA